MGKRENLRFLFKSNHGAARKLIDDITEDESMFRGKDNINHICWQTGHLVYNAGLILNILGDNSAIPEKWIELFKRGAEFHDDNSVYPAMSELKKKLYSLYEQLSCALDGITDAFLDEKIDIVPGWNETRMNGILFFCTHEFYHCGQIVIIRRLLGREQPFG